MSFAAALGIGNDPALKELRSLNRNFAKLYELNHTAHKSSGVWDHDIDVVQQNRIYAPAHGAGEAGQGEVEGHVIAALVATSTALTALLLDNNPLGKSAAAR